MRKSIPSPVVPFFAAVCVVAALFAARIDAATDPALPGPFAPGLRTESIPVTGGDVLSTDLHFPDAAGSVDPAAGACPLLVYGHGFSSTKDMYAGHGAHWASRGYITLIPTMAGFSDHSKNADDLVVLIDWALAQNSDPGSWLYGRIDPGAIGISGHSAGGLSSLVAAARDPRIDAVAPMDPVDMADLGVNSVASIAGPVAITYSEDSSCNSNGSARVLYAACVPIKRGVKIVGATHCDPLDPPNVGCDLFCGASDAARMESYSRYVTGWFEFWLRCDPTYFDWVYGIHVQSDVTAGIVTYEADPDPGPVDPCGAAPPPEVLKLLAWRTDRDLNFIWDAVPPPVTEYRLYQDTVVPFSGELFRGAFPTESGFDLGAVDGEPLYFYRVRAANTAGEGP